MFKLNKQTKVILFIILLIIFVFVFQFLTKPKIDTNSYVTLISGEASLNNHPLILQQKKVLKANDLLETWKKESLVIIEWGEGSITRVWPNTKLKIDSTKISQDLTKIEIFFELLGNSWKTWSDVVSFIGEDSYFKQGFADTEAAVRWTTFEVNLDKDYVYVEKHEVLLQNRKNWKKYIIPEKKPFSIKLFDFVALEKFITSLRDKTWQEINKQLDKEALKKLKENVKQALREAQKLSQLKNIDLNDLPELEKEKLYKQLLSSYQNLKPSAISPADKDLYQYKLQYQEVLTSLAPKEDKQNLLRTSVYDLKEAINLKNFDDFKAIMKYIWKNKNFINLNDFNNIINFSWMKSSMKNSIIDFIKNTKNWKYTEFLGNSFDAFEKLNLKNTFENLNDKAKWIKENLPKLDNLWNSLNSITNWLFNN